MALLDELIKEIAALKRRLNKLEAMEATSGVYGDDTTDVRAYFNNGLTATLTKIDTPNITTGVYCEMDDTLTQDKAAGGITGVFASADLHQEGYDYLYYPAGIGLRGYVNVESDTGTPTVAGIVGLMGHAYNTGSGDVAESTSVLGAYNHNTGSGSIVESINFLAEGGNADYVYGLYVDSIDGYAAVSAYAIYTGTGEVRLGDDTNIIGQLRVGDDTNAALITLNGTDGGATTQGIYYDDSGGTARAMLLTPGSNVVAVTNRAANGVVQVRANTSTAGSGGEVTVAEFQDDLVTVNTNLNIENDNNLVFKGTDGGASQGVFYEDSGGTSRPGLFFPATNKVVLANRAANGTVEIRANTNTAGSGGEVDAIKVEDDQITNFTYVKKGFFSKALSDNSAGTVFTITTTNESGSADGGTYAVFVKALITNTAATQSTAAHAAAKSFQATFCRAMNSTGGVNSAVSEIVESASATTGSATRDVGACTMTVVETSEYVQSIQFTIDTTGSANTPYVFCWVEVVWSGFTTPPVLANA